jgi:excisionase family DNA binding protein
MSLASVPEAARAPVPTDGPLLTPDDCARRLSVSRSMVYSLIKRGHLRAVFVGRLPRVAPAELDRFIAAAGQTRS